MGRQYRSPRQGGGPGAHGGGALQFVGPSVVTSSSVLTVIPNYGVTDISTWGAGDYVMDLPVQGVEKTILSYGASTVARVIFCSTVQAGNVSIGGASNTRITFKTSDTCCITLIGVNSTGWAVRAMHPPTAVNATGIVLGTS